MFSGQFIGFVNQHLPGFASELFFFFPFDVRPIPAGAVLAVPAVVFGIGEARKGCTVVSGHWVAASICVAATSAFLFVPAAAYLAAFYGSRHRDGIRARFTSSGTAARGTHTASNPAGSDDGFVLVAGGFFGYSDAGQPVTANPRGAALVVGPPGSGKTRGVVMNSVACAPGAVVSTSIKTEVMAETHMVRAQHGRCWWFDPGGASGPPPAGVESMRWNPLCDVVDWGSALSVAARLTGPLRDTSGRSTGDHWVDKAESWCAALLYAAAGDLRAWARWCRLGMTSLEEASAALFDLVDDIPDDDLDGLAIAREVIAGLQATDAKELSGIASTVGRISKLYNNPAALAAGENPNFDPNLFVRSSDTLYISASTGDVKDYAPLLAGILESIRDAQEKRCQRVQLGHENQDFPVTFVLDEATNTAPIPLPIIASTAGGQGLHLVVAVQEPNQVRERWGQAGDGFLTLFPEILVLSGMRDERWTQQISRMSGEYDRMTSSLSMGQRSHHSRHGLLFNTPTGVSDSGPGISYQTQRTAQLSVADVANIPAGRGLYLHQHGWQLLTLNFYDQPHSAAQTSIDADVPAGEIDTTAAGSRPTERASGVSLAELTAAKMLRQPVIVIIVVTVIGLAVPVGIAAVANKNHSPQATVVNPVQTSYPPTSRNGHWVGSFLEDYVSPSNPCGSGTYYWVVVLNDEFPWDLSRQCIPSTIKNELDRAGDMSSWPTAVEYAVIDDQHVLSRHTGSGRLELVGLADVCLRRNGLSHFREGPLDMECLIFPDSP